MLEAIEGLGAVRALKSSFIAYPVVNAAHILAIGALLTSVILMDLKILGLFGDLEPAPLLRLLRRLALSAFALALLTGLAMFSIKARDYAANPVFLLKMGLIVLAGANFAVFRALAGAEYGPRWKRGTARTLAALSIALWIGVLLCGRFIGFL